jgi:hypothetical protein
MAGYVTIQQFMERGESRDVMDCRTREPERAAPQTAIHCGWLGRSPRKFGTASRSTP